MAGDIYVTLVDSLLSPFAGVVVKLYEDDGAFGVYLAEDTTDANGLASFVGYADDDYLVRVRVPAGNPFTVPAGLTQAVTVAGSDVSVTVTGASVTTPTSSDARYCRCSGYFTDLVGAAAAGRSLYFSRPEHIPAGTISSSQALGILGGTYQVTLSAAGYAEIDLPRGAELYVMLPDFIDDPQEIHIPDAASANLVDVVLPYLSSVTYVDGVTPTTTISVAAGATKTVALSGLLRSGVAAAPITTFLQYATPTAGYSFSITDSGETATLTVTGITAGTYSMVPLSIVDNFLLPEPTISGTLTVGVT